MTSFCLFIRLTKEMRFPLLTLILLQKLKSLCQAFKQRKDSNKKRCNLLFRYFSIQATSSKPRDRIFYLKNLFSMFNFKVSGSQFHLSFICIISTESCFYLLKDNPSLKILLYLYPDILSLSGAIHHLFLKAFLLFHSHAFT